LAVLLAQAGVSQARLPKRPQAGEVALGQQVSASGLAEVEFMYAAGRLLRRVALRSSRRKVAGCGELMISSRFSRSGRAAARFQASAPPQSCATSRSSGPPGLRSAHDVGHQVPGAVGRHLTAADDPG
jgi:hypothetical protein